MGAVSKFFALKSTKTRRTRHVIQSHGRHNISKLVWTACTGAYLEV